VVAAQRAFAIRSRAEA